MNNAFVKILFYSITYFEVSQLLNKHKSNRKIRITFLGSIGRKCSRYEVQ